jgi:hypothetical protein
MRKRMLVISLVAISIFVHSRAAYGCALSCAAICRYTCQGTPQEETGCGDGDYLGSLQRCCEEAFRTTPGIDRVPCTEGGGGGY